MIVNWNYRFLLGGGGSGGGPAAAATAAVHFNSSAWETEIWESLRLMKPA